MCLYPTSNFRNHGVQSNRHFLSSSLPPVSFNRAMSIDTVPWVEDMQPHHPESTPSDDPASAKRHRVCIDAEPSADVFATGAGVVAAVDATRENGAYSSRAAITSLSKPAREVISSNGLSGLVTVVGVTLF